MALETPTYLPQALADADAGTPHVAQVARWNRVTAAHAESIRVHQEARGSLPAEVAEKIALLDEGILQLRAYVSNPDNYSPEAKKIPDSYEKADSIPWETTEERVAHRLAQFSEKPHIVTDVDGTLTVLNGQLVHSLDLSQLSGNHNSYLTIAIPGSEVLEAELDRIGRDRFAEAYVRTLQHIYHDSHDVARRGGQHIEIRQGVNNFFGYARNENMHVSILSANFEPVVEGILDQIPNAEGVDMWTVRERSIISTDKGTMLRHLAQTNPHSPIIYIGDGESDQYAIESEAVKRVACYFALRGGKFEAMLQERGIPYFAYDTFDEIYAKMEEIKSMQLSFAA